MSKFNQDAQRLIDTYQVFPKNVGRWTGEVRFLDANLQELRRYQIEQDFQSFSDKWVITNTYIFADDTSSTQSFDVLPTGAGRVRVEVVGNNPQFQNYQLSALEQENNIITFKVVHATTGLLREVETITFAGENQRVRTAHIFTETGDLSGFLLIQENRVA